MEKLTSNQYHLSKEISHFINIENSKFIAFILMICFSVYNAYLMAIYGGNSCKWLLTDGHFQGNYKWQPYGCMIHQYSYSDTRTCLSYIAYWGGKSRITLVGDSRIRGLYFHLIGHLAKVADQSDTNTAAKPLIPAEKHAHHSFSDSRYNLDVNFRWQPYPNSEVDAEYQRYADRIEPPPTVLLMSMGTWLLKTNNGSLAGLSEFQANLTRVSRHFRHLKKTRIIWMVQDPVQEKLLSTGRSMITNKLLDKYNDLAVRILAPLGVEIWSSNRMIALSAGFETSGSDGLHVSKQALDWYVQILLNMHCNNHIKFFDGTCCSIPEPVTKTQICTFAFFGICFVLALLCFLVERCWKGIPLTNGRRPKAFLATHHRAGSDFSADDSSLFSVIYELSSALAKLGFILVYFFVCDRTIFFMKENKSYTLISFLIPLIYVFVLGVFFTEHSQKAGVLHRDITDEWKGWMQLVILVYHITGASKHLPVYMHIRLLVSAYLFMTGYGHFTYFWTRGDFGLIRFSKVMFRLNLLVICLCFVMNRPYQFYYFVPLVSFWYLVLFLVMTCWPRITAESVEGKKGNCLWMLLKLVILVVLITLLYASEYVFDKVFLTNPLKSLFVSSEDKPHEWRFRWELDRYSIVYGMVFALFYQLLKQNKFLVDNHQLDLFSRPISVLLTFGSFLAVIGYTVFSLLCYDKVTCNVTHTYITALPIFGYVILRNCLGPIRQRYSTFFAWFGQISLELFIGQYHIWLAADTHGVLVITPGNPMINMALTSFLFVCVAHEIHRITAVLLPYAVPDDWRLVLRNLIIFMAAILPIAISHGVFAF